MITEVHQKGRFFRLSTGRAAHFENVKPHNLSTKDWCIPAEMEEGDYLMMDPVCEVKEKITSGKNDWNETLEEGSSLPLDRDHNEVIEANEETLPTQKRTGMTPNKQWSQEPGTRPSVCNTDTTE